MRGILLLRSSSLLLRAVGLAGTPGQPSVRPRLFSFLQENERRNIGRFSIKNYCLSSTVEYEADQPFDDGRAMDKALDKASMLNRALYQLAGDFDKESNLSLSRFSRARHMPVISTGSLMLDLALGIGGLPKGRMVEIYGKEASGKSTLALHIIKEAQKLGGICAYLDVENAMDFSLVEAMGVDKDNLLISSTDCAENLLSIVNTLVNSGSVDVIVIDSVAALVPRYELDSVIDIDSREKQSRLMTKALRKIHYSLCRSQSLIIFINQVRTNLRSSHGIGQQNEVTCGGTALKFYAAVRMRIRRTCLMHSEDETTGIGVSVEVIKNKLAPAMKKADLNITFGKGFCREGEILELASENKMITKEGDGYWITGKFFKDHLTAKQFLAANNDVADEFLDNLRFQLLDEATF